MSNNENDPRRNWERPEDNPFIAFRRFADSQVSSLLNTVFTLPATIANHNNAHKAREACLFKKAGKTQCDQLEQIEHELASLRQEGRELYIVGDLQEVLKKSEELMRLDRHADELRRDILSQSKEGEIDGDTKELVHRVANKRGQEWGWDWSWGFPKPFDDCDSNETTEALRPSDQSQAETIEVFRRIEEEAKSVFGEQAWNNARGTTMDAIESNPLFRSLLGEKGWEEFQRLFYAGGADALYQRQEDATGRREERRSRGTEYHGKNAYFGERNSPYSPQALESDRHLQETGVNWREAYNDLMQIHKGADKKALNDVRSARDTYPKPVSWTSTDTSDEPSYEYAHDHEDQHDDPPTPTINQGKATSWGWCAPAQREETSDKRDVQEFLREQQQEGRHLELRSNRPGVDQCGPAKEQNTPDRRDIQKYLREQQEQNGLQLSLRDPSEAAETELDVYEQLLEKPKAVQPSSNIAPVASQDDAKPSILSTLTTTERSVAPDGSVTTKVVLKKRFDDGREESSETVHTQRGHEVHPWHLDQPRVVPQSDKKEEAQDKETKRSGWFWSS